MCGTITVTRKLKSGKTIKYQMKDRGAPGRGKKVLPPAKSPGAMTAIATQMGYDKPTDVLIKDIPEYVDNLVTVHGQRSARGMIQKQLTFRKGMRSNVPNGVSRDKFQRMINYLDKAYAERGWE